MKTIYLYIFLSLFILKNIEAQEVPEVLVEKPSRYFNMTSIDLLYGSSNEQIMNSFAIHSVHNFKINDYFFIGLGNGIDFHVKKATVFPFFLRLGSSFLQKKVSPIIIQDIGYAFGIRKSNDYYYYYLIDNIGQGIYSNTFIGVQIKTKKKVAFHLGLEYLLQVQKFDIADNIIGWDDFILRSFNPQQKTSIQRLGIKMGFSL